MRERRKNSEYRMWRKKANCEGNKSKGREGEVEGSIIVPPAYLGQSIGLQGMKTSVWGQKA